MPRLIAIVLLLAAAFIGGVALAEAPKLEVVEEVDLLRAQLAESNAREAQTRAEALQLIAQQVREALRTKYKLGDADAIDPQTRQIRRAPKKTKPEAK